MDTCEVCERERPLYTLCGGDHDHLHACRECLARLLAAPTVVMHVQGNITKEAVRAMFERTKPHAW